MKAVEILMNEHRTIERAIGAMQAWAAAVRHDPDPQESEDLARFVSFLRDFVDGCHHAKEQDILFATMVQHGFPREQGPIAVMLHEHELGRALIATLASLVERPTPWNADDRQQLGDTVRTYAQLLREHIQKEDRVLYPLAEARLPSSAQDEITARCERFQEEQTRTGAHERLRALTERLIESYPAPTA